MFQTVKFLKSATICVFESEDGRPNDDDIVENEVMKWDVLDEHGDSMDVQFGDGSVAYGIPKNLFEVIKEE